MPEPRPIPIPYWYYSHKDEASALAAERAENSKWLNHDVPGIEMGENPEAPERLRLSLF